MFLGREQKLEALLLVWSSFSELFHESLERAFKETSEAALCHDPLSTNQVLSLRRNFYPCVSQSFLQIHPQCGCATELQAPE